MGGHRITAATFAVIMAAITWLPSSAEEAPVVALQQPISVVGFSCDCQSCRYGLPCCDDSSAAAVVPQCLKKAEGTTTCSDSAPYTVYFSDISSDKVATGCDDRGCDSGACGALGHGLLGQHCSRAAGSKCGTDGCCFDLCRQQGFWFRSEALLWWTPSDSIPVLATSSPLGTPEANAGVLGLPTTTHLFSDSLFGDLRGGGRIRFGKWATNCHVGFDGSFWMVSNDSDEHTWQSDGDPALAVPFFNVDPNVQAADAQLIGFDGLRTGQLSIHTSSEIFGGDASIRKALLCNSNACSKTSYRVDGVLGYRYFKVREGLRLSESSVSTAPAGPFVLGTTLDLFDDFQTRNEFHGGNLGMVFMRRADRWSAEMVSRVGIGNLNRQVRINGQTTVGVPGLAPTTRAGGVLAQPTNIGVYEDDDFVILPEFQLNLGYAVNCHTRLTAGYSFMYLGDVVRPGDVIDPNVNGLQFDASLPMVGPSRPSFAWRDSDMWLMGLTLGAEFTF